MRITVFILLFLAPLSLAHGETLFLGAGLEDARIKAGGGLHDHGLKNDMYVSPDRNIFGSLMSDMLLSEVCAPKRVDDIFQFSAAETSV
jgi:hypothetical protein